MDELRRHPWRKIVQSDIADVAIPVDEECAQWEALDAAIAAMGTVSHGQINLEEARSHALALLGQTKDLRVMAHLLRTLQHGRKPQEIALALLLFADYCERFWAAAAPQARAKLRLLKLILQRFSQAQEMFSQSSTAVEREVALESLERVRAALAAHQAPTEDIDPLRHAFAQAAARQSDAAPLPGTPARQAPPSPRPGDGGSASPETAPAPAVAINMANDLEWKRTLIRVAEVLCERAPGEPVGFRLRRHAIFSTLSEPLNREGKTDLAPFPADREAEIKAALSHAGFSEWMQVENILTSTPFWLEGHYISARMAVQQGYPAVAGAIKDELAALLARLPVLRHFRYSDDSAFMSDEMKAWLETTAAASAAAGEESGAVLRRFSEQGLEAAFALLNECPADSELRGHYHQLKCGVQLLAEAGYGVLAARQAESLLSACRTLTLEQWEPSFFEALSQIKNNKMN